MDGQTTGSGRKIAPQIAALTADTKLVTLSIGGNDIKWWSLVAPCFSPVGDANCRTNPAVEHAIDSALRGLPAKVDRVLAAVVRRASHARIVVVGHGGIFRTIGVFPRSDDQRRRCRVRGAILRPVQHSAAGRRRTCRRHVHRCVGRSRRARRVLANSVVCRELAGLGDSGATSNSPGKQGHRAADRRSARRHAGLADKKNALPQGRERASDLHIVVELGRIELPTYSMRTSRATNCAIAPGDRRRSTASNPITSTTCAAKHPTTSL